MNRFRMLEIGFSWGPRFLSGLFVQDFATSRVSARHTISLVEIFGVAESRLGPKRCPARREARALRSEATLRVDY
jgi:hypothetical protein